MPSSLVRTGEASAAGIARKWFLTGVRSDMGCQMIRTREIPHADTTLKRFLTSVRTHVASELVRARKASGAGLKRTSIRSFTWRCFGSFRELVVSFHFKYVTSTFHRSDVVVVAVIIGCRLGDLHDVVVVIIEEVVCGRIQ